MPVTELEAGRSSTYVQPQDKLAEPFSPNDLCKSWVVEWLAENNYDKKALQVHSCGLKVVALQCPTGHQKRVRITCHKDYCPRCGQKGSLAHKRRYLRAMDRLIWAPVLGYMIFTLPQEVSESRPDKIQLSKIEKEAGRIVQDNFNAPGCMARTHFIGEKTGQLHIHVNVLFPITETNGKGEVPKETLGNIRQHWTTFVNTTFSVNSSTTNVFYRFATTPVKMRHKIKYVTRPIVVAEKFLSLSSEEKKWYLSLTGWHNTRWYGQLSNNKYKEFLCSRGIDIRAHQEADITLAKNCPACGGQFKFKEILDVSDIPSNQFRRVDKDTWVDLEVFAALKNKASP